MLREFFCVPARRHLTVAWGGLVVFVLHAVFKAWFKFELNRWYGRFYDAVQSIDGTDSSLLPEPASAPLDAASGVAQAPLSGPSILLLVAGESGGYGAQDDDDDASGPVQRDAGSQLALSRDRVWHLLWQFALLCAPVVVVSPLARWCISMWRMSWRLALMRSYLAHYDHSSTPIEGTAQRLHEDTQRFEMGIGRCIVVVLDAVVSLAVFLPVLVEMGDSVHPFGLRWSYWLVAIAGGVAFVGLGVSAVVGRKLVDLEITNQRVEARLRTRLVLLEQDPNTLLRATSVSTSVSATTRRDAKACSLATGTVACAFAEDVASLRVNYRRLFDNFVAFNVWIGCYDQAMTLFPYFVVAPMLFASDPRERVTLGVLMRVANAFNEVFGAFSLLTENWASVNDFRSTLRRLCEFESHVYGRCEFDARLVGRLCAPGAPGCYAVPTNETMVTEMGEVSVSHLSTDEDDDRGVRVVVHDDLE